MKSYVLITGATGGLGKAFSAECAARGWDILLTDQNPEKLAWLADGMERLYGVNTLTRVCDLTDRHERSAFWDWAVKEGYRFHMLVNIAGMDFEGRFRERTTDELRTIIQLNVEGTIEMTRRALDFADPARILRVVTISSLAGFYPMPVKAVYAASKRFLLDFSLSMRQEFSPHDVTFTVVCPAGMPTTPGSIEGIKVQGLWGRLTTLNVGDVAALTIRSALAGKAIVIPGFLNKVIMGLGSLLPPALVAKLVSRRWTEARKKRAPQSGLTNIMLPQ